MSVLNNLVAFDKTCFSHEQVWEAVKDLSIFFVYRLQYLSFGIDFQKAYFSLLKSSHETIF